MYDLIIIGAGPAGMTAAVYAARKKLNALLLSSDFGGQPMNTPSVENYMGYQYIEGPELMSKFEEQVKHFPIARKIGEGAAALIKLDGGFEITTKGGEALQAKAVIVATGKRSRPLNVPGEARLRGRGVSYCVVCDGPLFAGEKVAIIGGGNSALEAVNDMVKIAEQVYLISNTPLTADGVLVDKAKAAANLTMLLSHTVTEVHGENRVSGITVRDNPAGTTQKFNVGGVFVEVGLIPNSELGKGLLRCNDSGEIEVNCANETGIPGLFAAGDATNVPEKQIVIAAGEGAKAALQAHKYLQRLK